jgi:hypothetical protein
MDVGRNILTQTLCFLDVHEVDFGALGLDRRSR